MLQRIESSWKKVRDPGKKLNEKAVDSRPHECSVGEAIYDAQDFEAISIFASIH